ncbi:MAG: hypothetical protein ACYTEQ_28620 [Planctomycetota bacterium]|jgi:hypothetical protein
MPTNQEILSKMTRAHFDTFLVAIVDDLSSDEVLAIPGVRVHIAEYFYQQVCDRYVERAREELAEAGEAGE